MVAELKSWAVGIEHETSPGVYATLSAVIADWTLWRFETANGVYLVAGKSAEGGRPPVPLGVAQALWGSAPRIHVNIGEDVQAFIHGTHLHSVKAEMRAVGDRFLQRIPVPFDPSPYDGQRLEVSLTTMPSPRSFSKVAQNDGVIDLTGLAEVIAAARALPRA